MADDTDKAIESPHRDVRLVRIHFGKIGHQFNINYRGNTMSFYLMKSDVNRNHVGDILIDKDRVESIVIFAKKFQDRVDPVYVLKVTMHSNDDWKAIYDSLEAAKKSAKEILGDKVDDETLNNLQAEV